MIQEEYLEALNKQEIAKKELDSSIRQREQLEADIKAMQGAASVQLKTQNEMDELLGIKIHPLFPKRAYFLLLQRRSSMASMAVSWNISLSVSWTCCSIVSSASVWPGTSGRMPVCSCSMRSTSWHSQSSAGESLVKYNQSKY